jgi:hypothetical protein
MITLVCAFNTRGDVELAECKRETDAHWMHAGMGATYDSNGKSVCANGRISAGLPEAATNPLRSLLSTSENVCLIRTAVLPNLSAGSCCGEV